MPCLAWPARLTRPRRLFAPPLVRPLAHLPQTCGTRRVFHKGWTSDIKKLERAWANEQAKKRELSEVADFMDMGGSEFEVKTGD